MLIPQTLLYRRPRSSLTIAMLISLVAFSTVACSTTATDPASGDTSPSSDTSSSSTTSSNASQSRMDVPDRQAHTEGQGAADKGPVDQGTSDRTTNKQPPAAKGRDVSMRPGDTAPLADNGSLRYLRMVNDSRCMPNVQCIWAGNAELAFQWKKPGGGQETFSLNSSSRGGATQHRLGSQTLTLVSLARGPSPEATLQLSPGS